MSREKFFVILKTKAAGMPHDMRIETTADSAKMAINNALFLLRKYGHAAYNVPKRAFAAELRRFMDLRIARPDDHVLLVDPLDEQWERALNLRAFVPSHEKGEK